ncbi:phospholipase ABHD3-like [Macrobrachium rosenbergii]|uniref:phospholipase ABHD3-like n=1 Tax=Macrobrachium rosenbergii TaxID=79674 RepID=UPI0034D492DC
MSVNSSFTLSDSFLDWLAIPVEGSFMGVAFAVVICYLLYYVNFVVEKPLLACRQGAWRDFLTERLPLIHECFWPTPWCLDGRLQTVVAFSIRTKMPRVQYQRETLSLKDGGIISLDWTSKPSRKDQPILLVLPGLTGTSQSQYVKGYLHNLRDLDVCCVIFNHRGMGRTELKTPRTYCGANSDDLEEALEHIHSLYPEAPILANGISLGGMVLGNFLVNRGEAASRYLVAALVYSVPWNLFVASESLEKPVFNLLINQSLTMAMRRLFCTFRKQLEGDFPWKFDHLMKSKTLREFDDRFTSLNFGFPGAEEYYKAASLDDKLHKIRVPFLCLTSADDPFLPKKGIPIDRANQSSHVALVVTSRGGHVGFLEGLFPYTTFYGDRLLRQYVSGVFSNLDKMEEIRQEGNQFVQQSV